MESQLRLSTNEYEALRRHLIPPEPVSEEVAFIFASVQSTDGGLRLVCREWTAIPPEGFLSRSLFHLELTDVTRSGAIRKAHQLETALVELHSHPYPYQARFSLSDISGLREFAPHVRWRLKGRPYGAIVVAPQTYDSLIWAVDSQAPSGTLDLAIDEKMLRPTGFSLAAWEEDSLESF